MAKIIGSLFILACIAFAVFLAVNGRGDLAIIWMIGVGVILLSAPKQKAGG